MGQGLQALASQCGQCDEVHSEVVIRSRVVAIRVGTAVHGDPVASGDQSLPDLLDGCLEASVARRHATSADHHKVQSIGRARAVHLFNLPAVRSDRTDVQLPGG